MSVRRVAFLFYFQKSQNRMLGEEGEKNKKKYLKVSEPPANKMKSTSVPYAARVRRLIVVGRFIAFVCLLAFPTVSIGCDL